MPAKKASKPKRKSSSSTLTKYSRSRPLGPELKWFDVNTPNSIVGFGLATLIQAQHCPFWHWTEPAYRSYHRGQRNRNQDQHASSLGLCRSHSPFSRWHQLSCRSHSDKQANGAVPLGADIYDTLVAGVSPENRFMNLLNSDRFSLVKRWEGDINPPSFIVPDATGSTLIVGRDLRLKKKCSIRVELTLMPPLPSLMLSPTTCCWSSSSNQNAGGALGVEVVNTFRHSHPFPGCVIVTFSIITESKH